MKVLASLIPALVIVASAGAASAQDVRIAWSDLNLSSPAGAAAFDARVETASRTLCRAARRPASRLGDQTFCRAAVRAEALRQLPNAAQVDYALGRLPLIV